MQYFSILTFLLLLLAGCAAGPKFSANESGLDVRPDEIAAAADSTHTAKVVWGGVIASSKNLADSTQLEVIAYPLSSSNQSPQTDEATQGRFMILSQGYLEPVDYAVGRKVTVTGNLGDRVSGLIGETEYQYPVVLPEEIYLWPKNSGNGTIPIRFGFGFIFHN